jgi:hypothetical protein
MSGADSKQPAPASASASAASSPAPTTSSSTSAPDSGSSSSKVAESLAEAVDKSTLTPEAVSTRLQALGVQFTAAQKAFVSGSIGRAASVLSEVVSGFEALHPLPADKIPREMVLRMALDQYV